MSLPRFRTIQAAQVKTYQDLSIGTEVRRTEADSCPDSFRTYFEPFWVQIHDI
jgi:hypothetical protein